MAAVRTYPCPALFLRELICLEFDVSFLGSEHFYAAPSGAEVNQCQCSTVYYNLISACAYCQNSTFLR